MESRFRYLPSVDKLLSEELIIQLQDTYPRALVTELVRQSLNHHRFSITQGNQCPTIAQIVESVCAQAQTLARCSLRPVINATGVIIHTNLGRAPLSKETAVDMTAVANGYCNLEFDLDSGRRGSRNAHIEHVLCQLTGAEAALVVNNNAAAVLLALTALARRREVIVSRGQAIEIGGGFRLPDVMRQSGSKLIEVGTTNCTYIADYEEAISPRTAALMRVHSSNFRQIGFTHSVTLAELVVLGNQYKLPVFDDLGSGCLLDTTCFGLDPEPMVQQSINLGTALVFFSGDKLIGGPQAGVIVGKKQFIDKLKKHPLARAARIDKVRLAGLVSTLIHYLKGEAIDKIPVWRMISAPIEEIDKRARMWAEPHKGFARVVEGESIVGGGSLPGSILPTRLVAIGEENKKKRQNVAEALSQELRCQEIPIVGRISDNILLLDPRSVLPEDDGIVLQALQSATVCLKHC